MTPETKARQLIDQKLEQAGWVIQDMQQLNLAAGVGIAVREYPTDSGPADYMLFVNRKAVGVIEAKKDGAGENLTVTENQTERYATANLEWRKDHAPLRFLFEATGQIIRFTDNADPAPRSREIFHFFKPETLVAWLAQTESLRRRLAEQMPALPERNLRDCQISAVTGLEKSLALSKPRALVHMATGAGKTFTAITSVYRLLKFGGAKRILFLVDTRNLGKQAHQEFMAYTPPDDGRKFTELYNVQRLASPSIDPHSQVCISTIERMYSILSGEPIDETAEDVSLNEVQQTAKQEKWVRYNPAVPVETFDFIIIDECHRSIYNLWKQVLDYFDASLTASPPHRTNAPLVSSKKTSSPNTPTNNPWPMASTSVTTCTRSKPKSPKRALSSAPASGWTTATGKPVKSAGAKPRRTLRIPAKSWTALWSTSAKSGKSSRP
jgi:type I restriction enzyme, R subunit